MDFPKFPFSVWISFLSLFDWFGRLGILTPRNQRHRRCFVVPSLQVLADLQNRYSVRSPVFGEWWRKVDCILYAFLNCCDQIYIYIIYINIHYYYIVWLYGIIRVYIYIHLSTPLLIGVSISDFTGDMDIPTKSWYVHLVVHFEFPPSLRTSPSTAQNRVCSRFKSMNFWLKSSSIEFNWHSGFISGFHPSIREKHPNHSDQITQSWGFWCDNLPWRQQAVNHPRGNISSIAYGFSFPKKNNEKISIQNWTKENIVSLLCSAGSRKNMLSYYPPWN